MHTFFISETENDIKAHSNFAFLDVILLTMQIEENNYNMPLFYKYI